MKRFDAGPLPSLMSTAFIVDIVAGYRNVVTGIGLKQAEKRRRTAAALQSIEEIKKPMQRHSAETEPICPRDSQQAAAA